MNPANALSQLSPGMAECHARLMAVAKHGTPEAFSATLAGVLQRAELSISNAYDAGAQSIQVDAAAAPDAANEITKAFREYLTVHPGIKLGGHEADTVARELALIAQPDAQPAERMPSWMQYDKRYDILTIHGKRYSASMFGDDGFIAPAGTLLRVEAGDPDCVTLHKITAVQPVAQDGALGLLKFNDDMGASITGLPAMTIKPGDEFLIFPKSPAQPSSDGTADQWSKSEIDAAIKVNAPPCIEAVINPDVAATALRAYIKDCEAHAIVPDVGGAWHAAFLAGAASRGKAPAVENDLWRKRLLTEDIAWLEMFVPNTKERSHIITVLRGVRDGQASAGAVPDEQLIAEYGIKASRMMARDLTRFDAACEVDKYLREQGAPGYYRHRMSIILFGNVEGTEASRAPENSEPSTTAQAAPSAPFNAETQDQIAAVMLQHGTEAQQRAALAYASGTAPAAGAVAGPSSADELARDLKKAIETATELREQLTLMEEHARGGVWRWQADGTDDLATMGNRMGVLIYASDLRNLIAAAPTPAAQQGDARLGAIEQAIRDYHYALDTRQHGGVAQDRAIISICTTLEMHWEQGKEANRRATLAQKEGNTHGN